MNFRYARHTSNIQILQKFYNEILGFQVLGNFVNHQGYDGVFLGFPDKDWHLEFTQNKDLPLSNFDEDDALVFYPLKLEEYEEISQNVLKYKVKSFLPKNPYWKENSLCFEDPDGFKIIISKIKIY